MRPQLFSRLLGPVLMMAVAAMQPLRAHAAGPALQELCLKDDACRQHYTSANELYKAGKLTAAISEYEAAYKEVQIPVFLYNLGRLHQRLGNLDQAAEHFRKYLTAGIDEDPAQRQRAQEYLKQIQEQQKPAVAAAPVALAPVATPVEKKPVYKTWWFWTATVGGAVVVGTAIGLGVGLSGNRVTVPDGLMGYQPTF